MILNSSCSIQRRELGKEPKGDKSINQKTDRNDPIIYNVLPNIPFILSNE